MIQERNANISLNYCEYFYSEMSESSSLLAMQNMQTLGYRDAVDKRLGLTPETAKLALSELAKFHACGYAFVQQEGGPEKAKEKYKVNILYMKVNLMDNLSALIYI